MPSMSSYLELHLLEIQTVFMILSYFISRKLVFTMSLHYITQQIHRVYVIFAMLADFPRMVASISLSCLWLIDTYATFYLLKIHRFEIRMRQCYHVQCMIVRELVHLLGEPEVNVLCFLFARWTFQECAGFPLKTPLKLTANRRCACI